MAWWFFHGRGVAASGAASSAHAGLSSASWAARRDGANKLPSPAAEQGRCLLWHRVWVRFGSRRQSRGGVRHGVDICQASLGSYIDLKLVSGHAGSRTALKTPPVAGAAPGQHRRPSHMVYQPEASAAAAARRRSQRRVGFADQPPPSPDAAFPPPALEIDEPAAVSH